MESSNLMCISEVDGSLGKSLFLNYESELSMIYFKASISWILHKELAIVLAKLRYLKLFSFKM